ncbi:MAG: ATP-binding cassette domain-containing protein, partial [Monoglobaceae bacterium]
MIEFRNVTKIYGASREAALDNVSFRIDKGDFVFLIGATGAGKTTAAR